MRRLPTGGQICDCDSCICIHAERRAIANAASEGLLIKGATMYVKLHPCFPCLNIYLYAGILMWFMTSKLLLNRA